MSETQQPPRFHAAWSHSYRDSEAIEQYALAELFDGSLHLESRTVYAGDPPGFFYDVHDEYLTRDQARQLAALLLAFADSPTAPGDER